MDTTKYQTGLRRLGTAIVDSIVFIPLLFVEQWVFSKTNNPYVIISWGIFISFLPLFYSVFLHYKYGQTIGKWVAGVKVLDISESKTLTFRQSLLRDSFYLVIALIGLFYFAFLIFQKDNAGNSYNEYNSFTEQAFLWWTIIELISMLTNQKKRAVHDYIAKSVVVRT